ncbi:hypothetical protein OROMI_001639 [Orobanche minor]
MLDILSNVVQKKRVARILFFKITPSQEILKIRDVQKKRVARILFFKIRPSQEILKIRHGTPLETEEILTYIKSPQNRSFWHFYSNLNVPSNVVQKKRVARILFFKIRPSQEILKFVMNVPSNVVHKKRVARNLFIKIRPSQEILKIRDGTPLEAEEILIYIKTPSNKSVWHFSSNLDVPTNVVQRKRVAQILFFKIRPSQEILKIQKSGADSVFKIRTSQEILKIRDGTPLETEEILIYIKKPSNKSVWHFSSNLDVPINVVHKKKVARILFFKIRPSQEILKIRDGPPLEAEEILIYIKKPSNKSVWHFSSKLDILSNVVQKKRVARIPFFKIRPSQEILKIRHGTPLETEEILTYIKSPQNRSFWHFYSNLDVPSNVVHKKRVVRNLFIKIRPSQEILKIRDGTSLEMEEILTYIKKPSKQIEKSGADFFFKIRPSQEILKIRHGTPLETEEILTYIKSPQNRSFWHFYSNLDIPSNVVQKKRVAHILFFKIRPSQEILKIRDGTPMEAEEILIYIKSPQNKSVWHFSSNLNVPSNVVQKKRVARIMFFKIRPSQEILKIRDDVPTNVVQRKRVAHILFFKIRPSQEILKIRHGTPLEAEEILTYIKSPQNRSFWHFYSNLDVPSNVVQKKRVARIMFFKIRPSQEILKIRDDVPTNVVQRKRVAHILFFKIRPSQEILKIRDGTPMEAEEILIYIKSPQNKSVWHFSSNLDVPSNVVQKKRVARIMFFKIRPSQEILKIRDDNLDVPTNVVQRKRVAHILFFKIRPSQEILKIRDGTPMEAEEILIYIKSPQNKSVWHFSSNLDVPSNVVQKKRVARIMFFKIRPSQEILKIRDGTPMEAEEILIYIKKPSRKSVWHFSSNLDVPSNVVQKKIVARILFFNLDVPTNVVQRKRVAHILFFKIRPSQEILKIRDGTPMEAEEILIYIKSPQNKSVWHFSSNLDVPSNVVQKKRVARIMFFKIRPSQEILKIRDDVPTNVVQRKRVAHILFFKIRPSQEILKIRDGTPMEAEEILIYIKSPQNKSVWHFSSNLDVPSNVVQKKRVARIMFFKIRPSQEILKIRDGTPMEAEEILIYIKKPSRKSVWHFSSNLDVPSNVVQKKIVARILFFKIRPSQEILKIRDGTLLEAEEILIYIKKPSNKSVWHFSSNLDVPINVVQKKRVARILFFKIRPSQEILKIRDGTPLEAEEILIYIKKPSNKSVWHFSSKLDILSNVVQKKRVARILFFKIRPSQEILKIRDGTPFTQEKSGADSVFKIRTSQEILKIRDGTPLETEEILIYIKKPSNKSVWHFSSNLDVPINVVHKKRVARILFFKIRPSQEILKIRDGPPLEAEEILIYIKKPSNKSVWHFSSKLDILSNVVQKKRVARIPFFKIRPSQEILKIRHGTPLETEEILTYIKSPQNRSFWHFYSNLDVPSNVVHKKRVVRNLFIKIRPSQEILKIRDDTSLEMEEILTYIKKPSKQIEILKIRHGTPLETEEILTYIKSPQNRSFWHFYSNLDIPSNVVQKKRVARILFFKIRPSQEILKIRDEILKIRDDVPTNVVQRKRVAHILFFKIRPSQEILKIRDGTPMEAEEILIYIKSPQNKSVWHFSSNLDVPSNVVQKKRVARIMFFNIRPSQEILKIRDVVQILFFKIRPSQEILKIRDDTPLETEEILTYIKSPQNRSNVPTNVVQRKRVAHILFFKIRPSQEILKIRDGTPMEAEEILIYIKSPQNKSVWHFSSNLDVPSNVVQKKRVARIMFFKIRPSQEILKIRDDVPINVVQRKRVAHILFFKIRPSQEILKIRDGTPMEAEEILIYIKSPQNKSVWHFSSNLDVPSNVVQKKRVARIMFFKIRPSQEILKIRDGTPMEAEEILIYIKKPSRKSVWHFSSNLDVPSNVVQKKIVARILFFKIRPSQEILKIRDGTPLEAEEILIYIKKPSNKSIWHFSSNLDVPINVVQKKRVARILFFKIRPSQEILKIRDGTPLEAEEILIYIKKPSNKSVWHFSSKLDILSNVVQKKRVARILFFKIRPSQEILKIRDGTLLEAEEILIYIKKPSNKSVWHFSSNLDVPINVVQKKRVARILFFKIRPSQEILKIRDGTPLEAEEILIYIKKPSNKSVWHFSSKLDILSNVVQKKRVARILFFKIRPSQEILKIRDGTPFTQEKSGADSVFKIRTSQEILKIRDGTPLETEEILIYIKKPSNKSVWHFSSNLDVPINVVHKKRVARILFFKIRPSQEILKIRDGPPLEAEEILIYIKKPSNKSVWHFSSKLDILSNVVQKKRVARIPFFKIRPSQEILKIRHGTPLETEEILTYIKSPQNRSFWHFYSNLDVPSNVVHKKRVVRNLFIKIRPSQEILKIRDGTSLEMEEILTYIKKPSKQIGLSGADFFFKIRPSQEILKIRHGTPLETEEILTYIKSPQNRSFWHFYSNLDIPSNVVQKKRVARILFFKIRPSQEILKIRDDVPTNVVQRKRVAHILFFKIRPSQEILKIRDGTPMEAEEILIYIKSPQNKSVWHFSSNLDVPSNVVQKKRVTRIMFFNIRPSQEILKIRDVQKKRVVQILFFKIRPSQEILKIRDDTPLETEEILTYIKSPQNRSVCNLDVPTNVVQRKRVAHILFFKIRPSQEILKIRDGTPMEAEEILIYIKSPQNKSVWHFSSNLDVPSNVVQKKRVARIMFFKIRPSQEILKIRDDVPINVVQRKRVAHILFFKIRPSQEILKIRDGTPMEAEEILIYIKSPQNKSVWHFSSNLDVPSNVVQKKRVARIMFFKIRPSQEILKIRDGTPMEAEEILIYIKKPSRKSVWHFSSNLDVPSNVVHKKIVARILFFKIRPSQEILKIRDGTPLEAEEILIYIKKPSNKSIWHFSSNLDVPINVVQKKRVARILFFKIRPSQEILKIRDGTPLEAEEILIYIKKPSNKSVWHFSSKLDILSNVVQKKRVARILFFKIRPSQEILKIRDGPSLETEEILT